MDTNKWKSVLVPKDVYLKIKEIAKLEGRTIGGQLRHIFSHYKSEDQQRVEEMVEEQSFNLLVQLGFDRSIIDLQKPQDLNFALI